MPLRSLCLTVLICVFGLLAPRAFAASIDEARALLIAGDYEAARQMGEELKTAQGYTLAAESLSAQILLADIDKISKRAKQARALAMQALALEPMLYDAQLQYALADGFITRSASPLMVWRKKLPQKTYDRISKFRTAYPDDARGMALEGAWHLAIIRKAGQKNGPKWFGASLSEGRALYEKASLRAPNDVIIKTNYAFALYALGADEYGDETKALLEEVSELTARNDLERRVSEIAAQVYAALNDPRRAKKRAEDFLDGKP